jgi:hypothetical protein
MKYFISRPQFFESACDLLARLYRAAYLENRLRKDGDQADSHGGGTCTRDQHTFGSMA